jgi:hypothetical protein
MRRLSTNGRSYRTLLKFAADKNWQHLSDRERNVILFTTENLIEKSLNIDRKIKI